MFGHRAASPDPALLAQVSDSADVDLGSYPEDALAVTGAYPARGALDPRPDSPSAFRRLDSQARKTAMQAALDRLVAEGTVTVPAGRSVTLKDVVTAGLDGKLAVAGQLTCLYQLSAWLRRHGLQAGMIVNMMTAAGLRDAAMPPGVWGPGMESCFGVPGPAGRVPVLLVEGGDAQAGTRCYALRTPRREFARMAAFLFADVITGEEALRADANLWFRFGQRVLKVESSFLRTAGDEVAHGRIITQSPRKKKQEPRYITVSPAELVDVMTTYFTDVAARTQ